MSPIRQFVFAKFEFAFATIKLVESNVPFALVRLKVVFATIELVVSNILAALVKFELVESITSCAVVHASVKATKKPPQLLQDGLTDII